MRHRRSRKNWSELLAATGLSRLVIQQDHHCMVTFRPEGTVKGPEIGGGAQY